MWRRSGDGEVYAYMPNEQVIWIVIKNFDNKALKWCDFDHGVIIDNCSNIEDDIDGIDDGKMWRYLNLAPFFQVEGFCEEPDVHCNYEFGHSLGRGAWRSLLV